MSPRSAAPPVLPERYRPWPDSDRALLGRGGASEVWRCQDTRLGVLVALKVLRSEGARLAGRLEREAALSASVVHPNVIALHDMGRTPDGKPYLAFALASDGSLLDHATRPPAWPVLKDLVIGLLDALGALHARSLLHLDVKLSNLLVHRVGPNARALWLADLGVARARFSEEEDEGVVLGTVGYMAPERLTGQHQLWGPPTDLFSVGAVLYRLLTGDLPYTAKDPVEALAQRQDPPRIVPVREGIEVPAGLEEIILAMLQPDRRARYDLAADVTRAIAALADVDEGPILGQAEPAPPRLALMAQQGDDSLINWPPPDVTAPRPLPRSDRTAGTSNIPWRKPAALRPPRQRPRPYFPRRVPQDPRLIVHREIPVIGRDRELDLLWAGARAVLRHRQPVVLTIQGPRGMGRTRLVDELTRTLERAGVAQGVTMDFAGRSGPNQGLEGALRELIPPLADPRAYRNDVARTLSRLRDLPVAACRHDAAALCEWVSPSAGSGPGDRTAARSFLVEWLTANAWRGLTWLWLEDVHLAGETDDAWAVVEMLLARPSATLVLCTVADPHAHHLALRPLRALEAAWPRRCQRLTLGPLHDADARRLIRAHLPMEQDLADELVRCAQGHPRFLHELIVHMVRQRALVPGPASDGTGQAAWTRAPDAPPLPSDRHDFARQLLQRVVGDDEALRYGLLATRLAGTGAPEQVVARVAGESLDRLVTHGLVQVQQGGLHIDSPELKLAISGMARPDGLDRVVHENLAAAWLEEGDDPQVEARAGVHLALAGRHGEALPLLRRALRRLQGTLRPLPLSRIALRAMHLARDAGDDGRPAWIEAALVRSEALWGLGLHEEALALDAEVEAELAEPEPSVRAACLHALHLAAIEGAHRGLQRLSAANDLLPLVPTSVQAELHTARGALHLAGHDRERALDDVVAALMCEPGPRTRARALLVQAEALAAVDPGAAAAAARKVQELATESGLLQAEIEAWDLVGRLAIAQGRLEEARQELEAGIVRLRRVGERAAAGHLLVTLATLQRDAGDQEAARTTYLEARALEATGREAFARRARLGLAVLAALQEDPTRVQLLSAAAPYAVEPDEQRAWRILQAVGAVLADEPPTLPADYELAIAAAADPDGLLLGELLGRTLGRADPAAGQRIRALVRDAAAEHHVSRRVVDRLLGAPG